MALGIAMTLDTPLHVKRVDLVQERHLVHPAMTRGAPYALVHMNAVVEVNEIGQIVDTNPLNRFTGSIALPHGLEKLGVRPYLRMAAHACLCRGNPGDGGRFNRCVAIATVDAVVADMVLMAERDRLIAGEFHIGDEGTGVHLVGPPYDAAQQKE